MDIVVLAGGLSPERDVSLSSGCLVANALMERGHRVLLADVYEGLPGHENFEQAYTAMKRERYEFTVPEREPDLAAIRAANGNRREPVGPGILPVCKSADAVFLGLHGDIGENGQLQAMFDLHGICYTGTGYRGSLLAMDKILSKELMRYHGVLTPDWMVWNVDNPPEKDAHFFPAVIKPCSCGSSIGVSIVERESELQEAVACAGKYESVLLVERKVSGREFSVGILDGKALPAIEIVPKAGFYDYKNKYQQGAATEICPADIDAATADQLRSAAEKVHSILRLGFYSRVDFMLDQSGNAYCLEANTLPGMTPTSLLPQEAAAAGISYGELCELLVMGAATDSDDDSASIPSASSI